MCGCKFYQEECLREGQAAKSSRVRMSDEGGLENLRKLVSRLRFRLTGTAVMRKVKMLVVSMHTEIITPRKVAEQSVVLQVRTAELE